MKNHDEKGELQSDGMYLIVKPGAIQLLHSDYDTHMMSTFKYNE